MMKMTYAIEGRMTAGGSNHGRFSHRFSDADGMVIIFQTYEEAVKKCEHLNSAKVDRNLVYSVERRLITTGPYPQK